MSEDHFSKQSLKLFGLKKNFDLLIKLKENKKFPKVLLLSGHKGQGKSTLINHFLNAIFDKKSYDFIKNKINPKSDYYLQTINNISPNTFYLSGKKFQNVKVDDIRVLKNNLLKTSFLKIERYIILDDVELFNQNSLNALLKVLEEPTQNNYFILINNKTKPLIETILSRAIEFKIFLQNNERIKIIESLISEHAIKVLLDYNFVDLQPGNFLIFNAICEKNKININSNVLVNIKILFNLYKKQKDTNLISFIFFLVDYHLYYPNKYNLQNIADINERKNFIIKNLNNFLNYNLNQNSVLNSISNKF